jgi:hypothetical protein
MSIEQAESVGSGSGSAEAEPARQDLGRPPVASLPTQDWVTDSAARVRYLRVGEVPRRCRRALGRHHHEVSSMMRS